LEICADKYSSDLLRSHWKCQSYTLTFPINLNRRQRYTVKLKCYEILLLQMGLELVSTAVSLVKRRAFKGTIKNKMDSLGSIIIRLLKIVSFTWGTLYFSSNVIVCLFCIRLTDFEIQRAIVRNRQFCLYPACIWRFSRGKISSHFTKIFGFTETRLPRPRVAR